MNRYRVWWFLALALGAPIVAFSLVRLLQQRYSPLPMSVGADHRIAAFRLTDQAGSAATNSDWQGKIVVANFFFTHCPSICPRMVRSLKRLQEVYPDDTSLLITSFSVDPERDSAGRLRLYASQMDIHGNWKLLTGAKKEIYLLARNSFHITATDGDGGPQDFIHSERLVLVDTKQRIRGYYSGIVDAEVDALIQDIQRLKKE